MNAIEKSKSIRAGLRKSFQEGTSKMARRMCYGYDIDLDGSLVINPDEAAIVRWIFDQYLSGSSLGAIATGLEKNGLMDRYLYTDAHEAIISDEMFQAVQQEKLSRAKNPENAVAMKFTF